MARLFSLVEDVVLSIFLHWFTMKELGMLDSATTSHQNFQRDLFLKLLQSECVVTGGINERDLIGRHFIFWLGLRRVSVTSIRISDTPSSIVELFSNSEIPLGKLKTMKIEGVDIDEMLPFDSIALRCISLEKLVVTAAKNNIDSFIKSFIQHCPKLVLLTVDAHAYFMDTVRCDYMLTKTYGYPQALTTVGLLAILQYGQNLTELAICNYHHITLNETDLIGTVEYGGLSKLTHLNTCDCLLFSDESLRILIENCHELVYFGVSLCPLVTDKTIEYVAPNNLNLTTVNLVLSGVQERGVMSISKHCTKIEQINMNATPVTDDTIVALINNNPNLTSLKCKHNTDVSDSVLEALSQNHVNFKCLYLGRISTDYMVNGGNQQPPANTNLSITYDALNKLCTTCCQIHTLDLTDCVDVDSVIQTITLKLPNIKNLTISKVGNVTESTMLQFTTVATQLSFLEATRCDCITDSVLSNLATHCVGMKILLLSSTPFSDKSLYALAEYCHVLSMLVITDCLQVTVNGILEVITHCPQLVTLHCFGINGSSLILNALIENSPFIYDVGVSEDTTVSMGTFHSVTCKAFKSAFPRTKLSCMRTMSLAV